ncbi:MAG: M3 family metallopeptidase [Cyanobacteriota bacterium]|nr:M3 family metallopeptidase [Cyanobacteriota bacterium]
MSELEKFIDLREEFSPALDKVLRGSEKSAWDFYINSSAENLKAYETAQNEFNTLFSDKKLYDKFKNINKNDLPHHEKKQLKDILRTFEERLESGELFKFLEQKENEIAQKYNSYIPEIDGRQTSKTEISKILQVETDADTRQKAYEANIKGGDLIAQDMKEFVIKRNEFAKNKGYDNFFDYKLKEDYDVDADFLEKLINEVYDNSKDKIKKIQDEKYSQLKEFFKTDNLQGWHYGLLTDTNPEKPVNKILEHYSVEDISKNTYKGMGFDIDRYLAKGNLTLDLYPRKGKNTHGFCFGIDPGRDSRILANLRNDTRSLDTLNHELGHCMYDLNISRDLTVIDRAPASSAFTEAIAMMGGDLQKRENILNNIIPEDKIIPFKNSFKKDEALFIANSLLIIDFEREMYKNPNQDLTKLWADLRLKYRNQNHKPNNEWATIPHYLSHPAYYQNYFRAAVMKAQIYNHLHEKLGNITENADTAKYMTDNIFSKGASVDEYDLVKELTGKEFSAKDFIANL